ncbi:hypothetical protein V6N13_061093 [Hibiscus sabdariffa]|uniref:Uncharacterized protein n=1 Tax=Hibiscus sabdariffa TaxID=183260 RepID=A0ABR2EI15_9ROSI
MVDVGIPLKTSFRDMELVIKAGPVIVVKGKSVRSVAAKSSKGNADHVSLVVSVATDLSKGLNSGGKRNLVVTNSASAHKEIPKEVYELPMGSTNQTTKETIRVIEEGKEIKQRGNMSRSLFGLIRSNGSKGGTRVSTSVKNIYGPKLLKKYERKNPILPVLFDWIPLLITPTNSPNNVVKQSGEAIGAIQVVETDVVQWRVYKAFEEVAGASLKV